MTSYGGDYYEYLKEIRLRALLRIFMGLKYPIGDEPNWSFISYEYFNYLYCKERMAIWRRAVKAIGIKCSFCGRKLIQYKQKWICGHGCTKPAIKAKLRGKMV